jgi:hypothetical protein
MADRVQFILDRMAPVFREMEHLDIFTAVYLHITLKILIGVPG